LLYYFLSAFIFSSEMCCQVLWKLYHFGFISLWRITVTCLCLFKFDFLSVFQSLCVGKQLNCVEVSKRTARRERQKLTEQLFLPRGVSGFVSGIKTKKLENENKTRKYKKRVRRCFGELAIRLDISQGKWKYENKVIIDSPPQRTYV